VALHRGERAMKACLQSFTCLNERRRVFAFPPTYTWNNPCISCMEGTARQLDKFVPENESQPGRPQERKKYSPLPPAACCDCGKKVSYGANRCRPCLDKSRTKTRDAKAAKEAARCG